MEIIIKAYGLITRCYDYDSERGYGCTECCNGDRCDEDCTARYRGGRHKCPHCKTKGRIPKEDAEVYPTRKLIDDLNAANFKIQSQREQVDSRYSDVPGSDY